MTTSLISRMLPGSLPNATTRTSTAPRPSRDLPGVTNPARGCLC